MLRLLALSSALALVACVDRSLLVPCDAPAASTDLGLPPNGDLASPPISQIAAQKMARPVDVLFVIDDSGSMEPIQWSVRQRFPRLLDRLTAAPGDGFDLHIALTTTDIGAPGLSCGHGRGGVLQRIGAGAGRDCQALADPYLSLITSTGMTNAPSGQTPAETFGCMAQTGEIGCGYEMPLAAVERVLRDGESGFPRPDALLVVVIVTDEDDCSVDADSDLFVNHVYGPLNSFRCSRFGVVCDGQLLPDEPQASFGSCRPATAADGGKLGELDRYRAVLTDGSPTGPRDPSRVVVATLSAPAGPVATVERHGPTICGTNVEACTQLAPSCARGTRDGDPAVRLDALAQSLPNRVRGSICDDDYGAFFDALADAIVVTP